jgi:hypothetical protein
MADPLGNTVDLRATPVRDVTARGDSVREELIGWYVRMCDRNAEDARKEYKQGSNPHEDGTEYLERAQAWEGRAEAARRGMKRISRTGTMRIGIDSSLQSAGGCLGWRSWRMTWRFSSSWSLWSMPL